MNGPLALLAVLLEAACILQGSSLLAETEGDTPPLPQPAAPRPAVSERTPVNVEGMLARPLFTPGRTVLRRERTPAPEEPVAPPRLTGLIVAERRGRAIFAGPDGKPVVAGEGDRLGSFTVVAVRPDRVELAGPSGVRTLRPSRDAALRSRSAGQAPVLALPVLALIDPGRREAETESDQ